jgi:hypothetical protein
MLCRDRIKIGIAKDVQRRRAGLQTANPDLVTVLFHERVPAPLAHEAEACAHETLRQYHVRGEWFEVEEDKAHEAVLAAIRKVTGRKDVVDQALADLAGIRQARGRNETEEQLEDYPEEIADLVGVNRFSFWNR